MLDNINKDMTEINQSVLISIVMPVFNAESFLVESIQSVLEQKYKNFELICVNDGSNDNSLEVLKEFEKKDSRIKVFSQANSGPAQARKKGFEKSKGSYITLLDADDKLSLDFLLETIKSAIITNADVTMPILISNWDPVKLRETNFSKANNLNEGLELKPREAFLRTFPWTVYGTNLYKAEHLKKYAISDISNVNNYNADGYLTRYLLLYANKIVVSKGKYYYRNNPASITKSFSLKQLGPLKTNFLLYELAVKENFTPRELSIISIDLLNLLYTTKRNLIINKAVISKEDFNKAFDLIKEYSIKRNWIETLEIDRLKFKKKLFLLNTCKFTSIIVISLEYKLNKIRKRIKNYIIDSFNKDKK